MSKTLVIGEKPSVAGDIARALGGAERHKDYFESDRYVVTSAVGHLVEIYNPAEETADHKPARKKKAPARKGAAAPSKTRPGKWSLDSLPVLPDRFALRPARNMQGRVSLIGKLARRDDVGQIVNACDAGREGELIFSYLASYLRFDKPVARLWLQSMTKQAIVTGFASLREAQQLAPLREAATARSEADWLIGINATRALTALNSKDGGFVLTTSGRVQTPTLALMVARERERLAHVPKPYWLLDVACQVAAGGYVARWVKSAAAASPAAAGDGRGRIWDEALAGRLHAALTGGEQPPSGPAEDVSKPRRVAAPQLFDLNGLQREANRRHGLPARSTLQAAQALYDRHKLLTYPRTESRHLPPDYVQVAHATLAKLADGGASGGAPDMGQLAKLSRDARAGVDKAGNKVFDAAKVTDHFAIIPTGELPRAALPEREQKVYDLVVRRFVAAFLPPAQLRDTVRTTQIGDEIFETRGSVTVVPGWMAAAMPNKSDKQLPPLAGPTEQAQVTDVDLQAKQTTPPARYDDASLLAAMQGAYKLVEEEELASALQQGGGLGTPATRAAIIEELIRHEYVVRDGRYLIPTKRAFSLIELLSGMQIEVLTKPQLTGQWESRLKCIEHGEQSAAEFMGDIRDLAGKIAAVAKQYDPDATAGDYATLDVDCPRCASAKMREGYRKYQCANEQCRFFIWKAIASRALAPAEAETLLREGQLGPLSDFKSRLGSEFEATIKLEPSGKMAFEFAGDQDLQADFAQLPIIGPCPKCGADVGAASSTYLCRNLGGGKCDFRLSRTIKKRELTEAECAVLLRERKSDLLRDFVSKYNKPFAAWLVFDQNGKLGFEFEKRAAKPAAARRAKRPARRKAE